MPVIAPLMRAAQALEHGDPAGAERILLGLLDGRENPDALLLLARVKENSPQEALSLVERARAARPGHAATLFHLGRVLAQLRRDPEAARAFDDALLWEPGLAEAWYALGEVQQRLGDWPAAETAFRRLLSIQPGHLLGKLALGLTLKQSGQLKDAEALFAAGLAEAKDGLMKAAFAYNLALAQHEEGDNGSALANFTLVSKLDPGAGDVARAAILEDMQRPGEAARLLEEVIARQPLNPSAHAAYNNLLYRQGREADLLKSYDRAPPAPPLLLGKAGFLLKTGRVQDAHELYAGIAAREPHNPDAILGAAAALSRLSRPGEALALLDHALARHPQNLSLHHQLAATALQLRDAEKARATAQKAIALAPLDQYGLSLLGLAWRMLGDERDEILNGYDELIAVFDLDPPAGFATMAEFNAELSAWLEQRHAGMRTPLDQTLRGGSQTSGHLFNTAHPLLDKLKARIAAAVELYIAGFGADARHPFRGRRRQSFRFTGSWSSRLADCGYHVNHVHPEGWISSCYYVGVPGAAADQKERQGWIKFGEPSFDAGLAPRRFIQPVPGRLVLFPSYMWHGTIPFRDASPRTTIAFDAVPRAS